MRQPAGLDAARELEALNWSSFISVSNYRLIYQRVELTPIHSNATPFTLLNNS